MRSVAFLLVCLLATPAVLAIPAFHDAPMPERVLSTMGALSDLKCVDGKAGDFDCHGVDLAAFVPLSDMGCTSTGNDVWGWADPETDREYALMGCNNGISFVDVTDPVAPVYIGRLPTHTVSSLWRDAKVYADHAFVVSEASGHGLQVFDLGELREVTDPPVTFTATSHNDSFGNAHNIEVNADTGYAYVVGSAQCNGGLHIIDISEPANPQVAGCFAEDGYTHDVQCVIYHGPDENYQGREICFASNENTLTIVDVTNKANPQMLGRETYPGVGYTHQGWLTEDHAQFLLDDELDELNFGHNTRTRVWDVGDLNAPVIIGIYDSTEDATDHNLYIKGNFCYQANYSAGLRILDLEDVAEGTLVEAAYFDVIPDGFHLRHDGAGFFGAWSNFPFFDSGTVLVSTIGMEGEPGGLFVTRPRLEESAIEGTVTDALTGESIEGVHIEIIAGLPHEGSTDSDGVYGIEILPGVYTVVASRPGYHEVSISAVEVDESGPAVVDLEMTPAPRAEVGPESIEIEVFAGYAGGAELTIDNLGGGELVWSIETEPVSALFHAGGHDPSLDEVLDVGDFSIDSPANGGNAATFVLPAGVGSQGEVTGLSFAGTVDGISGNASWASDMCMRVESPDGTVFTVGGFSGTQPGCNDEDWDFQGADGDGTYSSEHFAAFDPAEPDQGEWSLSFINDWNSTSAATMQWTDVTVTLHKTPLPICQQPAEVDWLTVEPESGSLPGGQGEQVSVRADASELTPGVYEATLCVATNDEFAMLVPVPVSLEVSEAPPGEFTVNPGLLDFGPVSIVDSAEPLTVQIVNTGLVDITIVQIETPASPFARLTDEDCGDPPFTLAPDESCEIGFSFAPGVAGPHAASVEVVSEAAGTELIELQGQGIAPELDIDPPVIDFGVVPIGETTLSDIVTLTNTGDADLEIEALDLQGSDTIQLLEDDCSGAVLVPGSYCSLHFSFTPQQEGIHDALVTVSSNLPDGEREVTLAGRTVQVFQDRFEP
jgi:choice-of-anchor B domain-containing protein